MATKNLKVLMSGDTKPYRAEIDQAAIATKTMKENIGGQMNSLAELFGTNMGTIGKSSEKISIVFQGLLASLKGAVGGGSALTLANVALATSGTAVAGAEARLAVATEVLQQIQRRDVVTTDELAGAQLELKLASNNLAKQLELQAIAQKGVTAATSFGTAAMKLFRLAVIGTGIGALIVVLGSLIAYFTGTQEGANKIKVALAAVGAVVRTLKDHFTSLGEAAWKFFTFDFSGAAKAMKTAYTGLGSDLLKNASIEAELARQTQALNKEERENKVLQQQRMTRAAQLRNDAKQEGVDAADKKKMLAEAKSLIIEYYAEEKHIAEGRRDIAIEDSKTHKNMSDELEKVEDAKVKVLLTDQESAEAQKALSREMKGVNKEIAAQTDAIIKKALEQRKLDIAEDKKLGGKMQVKDKDMSFKTQETITREYKDDKKAAQKKLEDDPNYLFNKGIKESQNLSDQRWRKEQENIKKTKAGTIDLTSSIQGALCELSIGVGDFLGGLLAGEGNLQSFGDMISGVFGNLATSVGKQMIQFGFAGVALQKLTLTPWAAVAAGIALVALGSFATKSISHTVSGGAGGAGGGQNYNYDTRGITAQVATQKVLVTVNGTLNASVKGLTATLSKENTRVKVST